MPRRLEYIENSRERPLPKTGKHSAELQDEEKYGYGTLAIYDFSGEGPRPALDENGRELQSPLAVQTRGERLAPILIRMGWVLLRSLLIFLFFYLFLRGQNFMCMGTRYFLR
jgi:hypothetical protein